jgi:hypothetical protein
MDNIDISHKEFERQKKAEKVTGFHRVLKEEDGVLYVLKQVEGGYKWFLPTEIQLENINKDRVRHGGKPYIQ